MSASFNSEDLFSTGPRRFREEPHGAAILVNARVNPFQAGSQPIGPLEPAVIVSGRLIADSEEELWAMRDFITARLTNPPTVAELFDDHGRRWADMAFVNFTPADRTDRGRQLSLAYTMRFIKFA